ncbi:MAG: prepilin-type N-terminal cleavage/methylation domain-containing protein [Candidatus Rokubacteria bacterium]|nr:prepilin-type N-terminal cleavage/methylation domain-containing protein [Candidatus Rokubacteria bacterium]
MRRDDGFTLAELLVACAVIAFVMAGLLVMLQSGQQSYLVGSNQVEAQQNVRVALERMIREIRGAGYCPNCGGTPPFTAIASQSTTGFTIQNDWDGSATISTSGTVTDYAGTTHGEQVIYAVSGGALTRQEIGLDGSPVTLASGISSMTFTYQDDTGAVTATAADIRTIVVTLTAQPQFQPAATQQGRILVTMTDSVRLRNR